MNTLVFIYVGIGCVLFAILIILFRKWLTTRQIYKTVNEFRRHKAVSIDTAKSAEELGYKFKSPNAALYVADIAATIFMGAGGLTNKSTKQEVFEQLIAAKIVLSTSNGKMYLSEENLLLSEKQYNLNLDKTKKALNANTSAGIPESNTILSKRKSDAPSPHLHLQQSTFRKTTNSTSIFLLFLIIGSALSLFSIRVSCDQAIQSEHGNGVEIGMPGSVLEILFFTGLSCILLAGILFLIIKLKQKK